MKWHGQVMLLGLLLCLVTQSKLGADPASDGRWQLRVLSYNIHHGEGVDHQLDLSRIAKVIQSVRPDLVALQEVDKQARRTNQVDQAKELARLTGLHVVFGGNIQLQGGEYGNAVLSRFPVIRYENHLLPSFDNGEQRGVLEVDVVIGKAVTQEGGNVPLPDGAGASAAAGERGQQLGDQNSSMAGPKVRLLATHLDHRAAERERLASAAAINQLVSSRPALPTLLAGDLNAVPDSETLRTFKTQWKLANDQVLPTIPVNQPTRQIDFILFRPTDRWRVIEVRVLDEAVASDHRAIFAQLELLSGAAVE